MGSPAWERFGLTMQLIAAPLLVTPSKPAKLTIGLPKGEYADPPSDYVVKPVILWRPGEAEPASVALRETA
jgi:hypothetical protein